MDLGKLPPSLSASPFSASNKPFEQLCFSLGSSADLGGCTLLQGGKAVLIQLLKKNLGIAVMSLAGV